MAGNIQESSSSRIADTRKNNNPANLYSRKDENYITIFGWMTNRLKLSGNELLVYALIFSFTKNGTTEFHGSAGYIASALNMSRRTVVYTLKSLTDNGLIKKKTAGRYCHYSVSPAQNLHTSSAEIAQVSAQNLHSTCANFSHHIKSISKDHIKDGSSSASENSKSGNCSETTTTAFINKCKTLGYSISRTMAEKISAGMDTSWLYGQFTYPEFVDEKIVCCDKYLGKPHDEKLRIFIGTSKEWDEQQEEFHEWRNKKIAEAAAQEERLQEEAIALEKRRRIGHAKDCRPEKCKCSHPLEFKGELGICHACNSKYFFNEEKEMWEHSDPAEFESFIVQFQNRIATKRELREKAEAVLNGARQAGQKRNEQAGGRNDRQ